MPVVEFGVVLSTAQPQHGQLRSAAWSVRHGVLTVYGLRSVEKLGGTMARKVFYSFHYKPDCWRAATVRNIGVIEGNRPATDNEWESIKKGGDAAIQRWIDEQLKGKSCAVVLIGSATAGRKWIKYEIRKAWSDGKGVVGIYIHNLKDKDGNQSTKGANPFEGITVDGVKLSSVVKAYDPPFSTSTYVYDHIKQNLENWVEAAIAIRNSN